MTVAQGNKEGGGGPGREQRRAGRGEAPWEYVAAPKKEGGRAIATNGQWTLQGKRWAAAETGPGRQGLRAQRRLEGGKWSFTSALMSEHSFLAAPSAPFAAISSASFWALWEEVEPLAASSCSRLMFTAPSRATTSASALRSSVTILAAVCTSFQSTSARVGGIDEPSAVPRSKALVKDGRRLNCWTGMWTGEGAGPTSSSWAQKQKS